MELEIFFESKISSFEQILIKKLFLFFRLLVVFVTSRAGNNLAQINGRMYKRIKGRMYRSYYKCIETKCDAEVIVNDLKGGFIRIVREHRSFCTNTSKSKVKVG